MADHENDTDPNAAAPAPAGDSPAAESSAADPNAENNGQAPDAGGEGGDAPADASKADEGTDGTGGNADEVQTRRHNKVNAAARVAQKNASPDAPAAPASDAQPNELDSVKAELADLRSREEAREDEAEINQIVADNAELKPYVDRVKNLAKDPSRKQVPIKSLFYEAAGDDLIKIGARRASEANADAAETQQNGTSTGNAPTGVSVNDMPAEDFQKMQEEVRLKQ